jgi:hypothetical protein
MSRLVRALLGLPKPKGSDEREPDDDDPPYPDVTVVVIINKRSGSRLVRGRTASRPFDSHCFPRRIFISSFIRPARGA